MRKSIKLFTVTIALAMVALIWALPYIKMALAGTAHYTEQDKREYQFYTPDILKKIPRISSQYDFDFANITGPASQVYAIRYYNTHDSSKVDQWLHSRGYIKQKQCHIEAECWIGTDPQEVVTVTLLDSPQSILVSVIYNL